MASRNGDWRTDPSDPFVRPKSPWLILQDRDDLVINCSCIEFYPLYARYALSYRHPPTRLKWTTCLNSAGDRLMVLDYRSNLFIFDPLSGDSVRLPPFSTFPDVETVYQHPTAPVFDPFSAFPDNEAAFQQPPSGPVVSHYRFPDSEKEGEMVIHSVKDAGMAYLRKAILGGGDTVLAIAGGRLAFTRRGQNHWTGVEAPFSSRFEDILYLDNARRFLSLDDRGRVAVIRGRYKLKVDSTFFTPSLEVCDCRQRYLALLSGRLYQVLRIAEVAWNDQRTWRFEVYKAFGHDWFRVTDLGGYSFFVGRNPTLSVPPGASPAVRENCIYFTDDYPELNLPPKPKIRDIGIFSLENNAFNTYLPDGSCNWSWPRPVWFMPGCIAKQDLPDFAQGTLPRIEEEGKKHSKYEHWKDRRERTRTGVKRKR